MFHAFSVKTVTYAANKGYVEKNRQDVYIYGLELLLTILFTDITVLFIGISMRMVLEAVVFWFLYKLLKKYVGGYHFSSQLLCYLSTCAMVYIGLLAIKYCAYSAHTGTIITSFVAVTVFLLSPIPAENKPLDEREIKVFGFTAKILTLTVTIIYSFLIKAELLYASKIITAALFFICVFAVIGKIRLLKVRQH